MENIYEFQEEAKDMRNFIEKLIHENIRLYFEVKLLRKNLEELKSLKAWWKGSEGYRN